MGINTNITGAAAALGTDLSQLVDLQGLQEKTENAAVGFMALQAVLAPLQYSISSSHSVYQTIQSIADKASQTTIR